MMELIIAYLQKNLIVMVKIVLITYAYTTFIHNLILP